MTYPSASQVRQSLAPNLRPAILGVSLDPLRHNRNLSLMQRDLLRLSAQWRKILTAPEVEVLLPTRAPAPWLGETLAGLANQTFNNWRLVAVLDGPDEGISEAIAYWAPTAKVITVSGHPGLVSLLNTGLRNCEAPLIARLDSDDVPSPERLERQVEFMESHPTCVLLGTGARVISEDGSVIGSRMPRKGSVRRRLRWKSAFVHPSVMMRSSAVKDVGGYRESARHVEDFDLWLRLAAIGQVAVLPEALLDYRIHTGQVTHQVSFDKAARASILDARLGLARAERGSLALARLRHTAWSMANRYKGR